MLCGAKVLTKKKLYLRAKPKHKRLCGFLRWTNRHGFQFKEMKENLINLLNEIKGSSVSVESISASSDLVRDFGLSSLDMMQFILRIEEEFNISIDLEYFELSYFNNLGQLTAFVERAQKASADA